MKRKTSMFAGLLLFLAPLALAQQPQYQSSSSRIDDSLASQQLIAWSWMQKPQPAPQPLPPPDKTIPQPDQSSAQSPNPQGAQTSQPQSQTFTGKIVKDGDRYVLKVAGNTSYQLDDQSSVNQYEDKDVKIIGTLDAGSNTIRVVKIELMS